MLLQAAHLSVRLADKDILSDVACSIEAGTWTGLLGPNGSGKTTLLRTMAGLLDYEGQLTLNGREVSAFGARSMASRVAFVRQSRSLAFDFRVMDLVLLGRSPHKSMISSYDHNDEDRALNALEKVDLSGFEKRSFHSLSGGEQQRVFLAQALVQEAEVLILDEPTTYLDVHHQYEFMEHVRSLVDSGCTVIGAFHDLELSSRFADQLVILHQGRSVAAGRPSDVLTPDLLESVFRMKGTVRTDGDSGLRIAYERPI